MSTQIDSQSLAYLIVSKWLHEKGHLETLQTFQTEAKDKFDSITKHFHQKELSETLETIIEEFELQKVAVELKRVVLDRKYDSILDLPGNGWIDSVAATLQDVHTLNITCVKAKVFPGSLFNQSGQVSAVITGGADKKLRITSESGSTLTFFSTGSTPLSIDVHPTESNLVAVSAMDGSLTVYDLHTAEVLHSWKDHSKYATRCAFSPNGKWLVSSSYDRSINVYEYDGTFTKKTCLNYFLGAVESIAFVAPATLIVGTRDDNFLHYVDLGPEFLRRKYNTNPNGDDWVSFSPMDLAVSPSGKHIVIYTDQKAGRLIILRTESSIHVKSLYGVECDGFSQPRCCWSSDGAYIYATSDDFKIWVYEVSSGKVVEKLAGHTGVVRDVARDGSKLVSASFDKTVRIWKRADADVAME
jgi:COMPASS component SWD3